MSAKKGSKYIPCSQCTELQSFNKLENTGKCLRDSKYKDLKVDKCEYGQYKKASN
jgi:hypothetical protein